MGTLMSGKVDGLSSFEKGLLMTLSPEVLICCPHEDTSGSPVLEDKDEDIVKLSATRTRTA